MADRAPGAHVLRLLLHPHDLAQVRIAADQLGRLRRPGTGTAVRAARPRRRSRRRTPRARRCRSRPCPTQRTSRVTSSSTRSGSSSTGRNEPSRQLGERRRRALQPQQALRGEHDERPRRRHERLPAQQVEVLRRRRAVRDPDVRLRRELEEALERARSSARARCPRSRAAAAASAATSPPTSTGRSTMNWSMTICAPLTKSPNCASHSTSASRRGDRVAVLEADARVLRERRVEDLERGASRRRAAGSASSARPFSASCRTRWRCEKVPRSVSWPVSRTGMPSTSERRERERLGLAPVDAALVDRRRGAARAGAGASGGS